MKVQRVFFPFPEMPLARHHTSHEGQGCARTTALALRFARPASMLALMRYNVPGSPIYRERTFSIGCADQDRKSHLKYQCTALTITHPRAVVSKVNLLHRKQYGREHEPTRVYINPSLLCSWNRHLEIFLILRNRLPRLE